MSASTIVFGFYSAAFANLLADLLYLQAFAFGERALVIPSWVLVVLTAPVLVCAPVYLIAYWSRRWIQLDHRFLQMAFSTRPSTALIGVILFTSLVRLAANALATPDLSGAHQAFRAVLDNLGMLTIMALGAYSYLILRLVRAVRTITEFNLPGTRRSAAQH